MTDCHIERAYNLVVSINEYSTNLGIIESGPAYLLHAFDIELIDIHVGIVCQFVVIAISECSTVVGGIYTGEGLHKNLGEFLAIDLRSG